LGALEKPFDDLRSHAGCIVGDVIVDQSQAPFGAVGPVDLHALRPNSLATSSTGIVRLASLS
jgi:hypothetical protein